MELQRRRKIAENIINRVLDSGYPETMKELTEELGLEIDSPAKFSWVQIEPQKRKTHSQKNII